MARARWLAERTGRPCIPIFWLQTEDHDWAEVARFDGCVRGELDHRPTRHPSASAEARVSLAHRRLPPEVEVQLASVVRALDVAAARRRGERAARAPLRPRPFSGRRVRRRPRRALRRRGPGPARSADPGHGRARRAAHPLRAGRGARPSVRSSRSAVPSWPAAASTRRCHTREASLAFFHPAGPEGPRFRPERAGNGVLHPARPRVAGRAARAPRRRSAVVQHLGAAPPAGPGHAAAHRGLPRRAGRVHVLRAAPAAVRLAGRGAPDDRPARALPGGGPVDRRASWSGWGSRPEDTDQPVHVLAARLHAWPEWMDGSLRERLLGPHRAGAGDECAPRQWRSTPALARSVEKTRAHVARGRGPVHRPAAASGARLERRGTGALDALEPGDRRAPPGRPAPGAGARILGGRRRGGPAGAGLQPGGGRGARSHPRSGRCARERARVGIACFPTVGGSGVAASQLAMQLAARGHRVHVFSSAVPVRLAGDGPWTVHEVETLCEPPAGAVGEPLALARAMAEVSARESLDVLHVHYALPHGPAALLARELLRRQGRAPRRWSPRCTGPTSPASGHDAAMRAPGPRRGARERRGPHPVGVAAPDGVATRSLCRRASGSTWCPTSSIPEAFHPLDDGAGEVPALFPDLDWSPSEPPGGAAPRLQLPPGEAGGRRGPGAGRGAAPTACRPGAGGRRSGPRPRRRRWRSRSDVRDAVAFAGERRSLGDLFAHADLFLLPSEQESFGLAALESLASGVPVVASEVGGVAGGGDPRRDWLAGPTARSGGDGGGGAVRCWRTRRGGRRWAERRGPRRWRGSSRSPSSPGWRRSTARCRGPGSRAHRRAAALASHGIPRAHAALGFVRLGGRGSAPATMRGCLPRRRPPPMSSLGTMMEFPLTLDHLLVRAERMFPAVPVVSRLPDRSLHRTTYGEVGRRARALAEALARAGLRSGDRVATLMWNHAAHLETYLGVPLAGGVVHTLNLRLSPEELAFIIGHAARPVPARRRGAAPALGEGASARVDREGGGGLGGAGRRVRGAALDGDRRAGRHRAWPRATRAACATRPAPPGSPRAWCTRTAARCCTR